MTKPIPVKYNGKEYKSISELERQLGLPTGIIHGRMSRGYTLEEAVVQGNTTYEITLFGKQYKDMADVARAFGFNYVSFGSHFLTHGNLEDTVKYMLSREKLKVGDNVFDNLTQACSYYSINVSTVSHRISKKGYTLEEALTEPIKKHRNKKPYQFRGVAYASKREMIEDCGFSVHYVNYLVKSSELGLPTVLEFLIRFYEPYKINRPNLIHKTPFGIIDNIWYESKDTFCEAIGLKSIQVREFTTTRRMLDSYPLKEVLNEMSTLTRRGYIEVSTGLVVPMYDLRRKYKCGQDLILARGYAVKANIPIYPTMKYNPTITFAVKQDFERLLNKLKASRGLN